MNMTPFVIAFAVLGITTLGLALYRKFNAMHEEDLIHLGAGEEREIPEQVTLARRLDAIDRWGKTLTVLTIVLGLGLAAGYLYKAWLDPSSVPMTFYRR
jgi:hypothetical protein